MSGKTIDDKTIDDKKYAGKLAAFFLVPGTATYYLVKARKRLHQEGAYSTKDKVLDYVFNLPEALAVDALKLWGYAKLAEVVVERIR